jgi:hypothetical protein
MPLALVVAPADPRTGDPASRREALAWLRGQLARNSFDVVIVGSGQDALAAVEKAAPTITPGDTVFVHLTGRLEAADSLAFSADSAIPLRTLAEVFAARAPGTLSFVAELGYDESGIPAQAEHCLGAVIAALAFPDRRHAVLAAVRPLGAAASRVAFTRLAMSPAPKGTQGPMVEAWLGEMHQRAVSEPEAYAAASRFAFVAADPVSVAPAVVAPAFSEPLAVAPASLPEPPPLPPSFAFRAADPVLETTPTPPARYEAVTPLPAPAPTDSLMPPSSDDAAIAAATAAGDWTRAVLLRMDRLQTLHEPKARVRELVAIARILQVERNDPQGAIAALEEAREIEPGRPGVLRALRRGYEVVNRWGSAIDATGALAGVTESAQERAALRVAQARMALERMNDEVTAGSCLRAALQDDPRSADAHALAAAWPSLNIQPPLFESESAPPPEVEPPQAEPPQAEPPAAWHISLSGVDQMTAQSPTSPEPYAAAFAIHRRNGNTDGAFLAALALEELGAADVDQQMLIDQFRSVTPSRARTSLDGAAWQMLRAPGFDPVLAALFASVEEAAVSVKLEELRDARRLVPLDRAQRLSETSTASVVRSFQWAARFLGIACPDLYAIEDAPGIAVMHAPNPSTALGSGVLSGLSAKDLAFLGGRHLTYYRPEYHVLLYYPTREDLTALLFAAVQAVMPEAPSLPDAIRSLRMRILRKIGERDHASLLRAVRELNARGGQAKIGAWMRGVELTAARAGLLLCGDLGTGAAIVRSEERPIAELSTDERRNDLLAFSVSEAHLALRTRFIATSLESVPPAAGAAPAQRTLAAQ